MTKAEIRKQIKQLKRNLSDIEKSNAAHLAFSKLEALPQFKQAKNILCYHSLPDEISTLSFIEKWHKEKSFYLPRVNGDILEILQYSPSTLTEGAFNIKEPTGNTIANIFDMDIAIVPAVAYDKMGNRLGRGKGYYDKLLHNFNKTKIGIIYNCQLIPSLPSEKYDIPVDIVISEKQIIICNNTH